MGGLFLRGQRPTKAPPKNTVLQNTQEHHSPSSQERYRRLVCPQRRDARGKRILTGGSPLAEAYSSSSTFSLRTVQSSPWALVVITSMILHCLGLAVKRFGSPSINFWASPGLGGNLHALEEILPVEAFLV